MIGYDRTWEKDEALGLHDMVVEKRKKMDDAPKDVVEKDSKKELEFGKKKEYVVSCVFVQHRIFINSF